MSEIRAPMAGKIIEILVTAGATVEAEDELLIIESMKMEIPITATAAGAIAQIHVGAGDTVQEHDLLISFE